jgi:transcriptional regulator with XRE-family HTH domain
MEFGHPRANFCQMIVACQIRMARAALGWSVRALAEASGIADSTILRFETGKGGILAANLAKLQNTLEAAGTIFIPADAHGGPGVRLKA